MKSLNIKNNSFFLGKLKYLLQFCKRLVFITNKTEIKMKTLLDILAVVLVADLLWADEDVLYTVG